MLLNEGNYLILNRLNHGSAHGGKTRLEVVCKPGADRTPLEYQKVKPCR